MKPGRVIALIVGCLLLIPSIAMVAGGGLLTAAYGFGRGDDGYFDVTLDRLGTSTVALTARDLTFAAEPGSPDWLLDAIDLDTRLLVTNSGDRDVFVGIARDDDIEEYLAGTAHDEVTDIDGTSPDYRTRAGDNDIAPPGDQDFWEVSAEGGGTQQLEWEAQAGRWSVVVMNTDASPGLAVDVTVGAKSGSILPVGIAVTVFGIVLAAIAVALITFGSRRAGHERVPGATDAPGAVDVGGGGDMGPPHPLVIEARLDPDVSRWKWLVKWFLAIPHVIVLVFLWIAFVVVTFINGIAILFTRRSPRSLFDFQVGVLRWTWRVTYYAATGGLGTDRYPPFSLADDDSYPARFDIGHPGEFRRWLVLVKWWLLAIPHFLIIAAVSGANGADPERSGLSLLGVLVLIVGVTLLFTGRYPRSLFDLIIGINRWSYRVVVYVALMTDEYPPFRLDQGGAEPASQPLPPPTNDPHPTAPSPPPGTPAAPEQSDTAPSAT